MMRPWNFSAGPAALPEAVLQEVQAELLDWRGSGMSVMEMSHRGKEFSAITAETEADFRELLAIPANYRVLFLQGGATQLFAQVPLNLLQGRCADFWVTGSWSAKAYKEAQRVAGAGATRLAGSSEAAGFREFCKTDAVSPDAAYLHVCTNETIHGVELFDESVLPTQVPVVADMSSHILSRPIDVSRYGLIFAGAQKNIGPSGLTLAIVREDLLGHAPANLPSVLDLKVQADNGSMLNTPPTFAIYVAGRVFQWLKAQGGLAAMAEINQQKAALLYGAIDGSGGFYRNVVAPDVRSRMNVPFVLHDSTLNERFLAEAKAASLLSLKQHKSLGGMRASIYNAMPLAGVQALVAFMMDFQRRCG